MRNHPFVVDGQDPRPIKPYLGMYNYGAQTIQGSSFAHGVYSLAIIGFRKEFDKEIETFEDISLKEAKIKIKSYFEKHHGKPIDYSDLIEHLKIPLPTIVDACSELEKEGKIAPVY